MNLGWRVEQRDPHRRGEPRAMAHGHRRRGRRSERLVRAVRRRLGSALASLHRARRSAKRRRSRAVAFQTSLHTSDLPVTHSSRGEPRHTRRGAPPEARCSEAPRWVGRWYRSRRAAPQRISRERGAARPRPHPRSPARRRTTARDTTRLGRSNRVIPRLARRTARRGDGRRRPPSSRDRPRPTPRPRPGSRAIA